MPRFDRFNKNINGGTSFTDELKTNVGASAFTLLHSYFVDVNLVIRTASGGGGTLLTEGVDYSLGNQNAELTTEVQAVGGQSAWKVYNEITITNVTYQTGNLYFSGVIIADDNSWKDINYAVRHVKSLALTDNDNISATSDEWYEMYTMTNGANIIRANLPAAADAEDQRFKIKKIDSGAGCGVILPNGSEKIVCASGAELDKLFLFEKGDQPELWSDGTDWFIVNTWHPYFKSGWINRSDWTNVHLGFLQITYGSLSGTFIEGEHITGGTSLTDAIIIDDTGTVLTVVSVSGGTNNFTSAETITGTNSGATATVSSNTKNVDSNILHNWGVSPINLKHGLYVSEDKTDTLTYHIETAIAGGISGITGYQFYTIDTNSNYYQTGSSGLIYLDTAGGVSNFINTDDWFYDLKIILEV